MSEQIHTLTPQQFTTRIGVELQRVMSVASGAAHRAVGRGFFLASGSIMPVAPANSPHPGKLRFSVTAHVGSPSTRSPADAFAYGIPGRPEFDADVAEHEDGEAIFLTWPARASDTRDFRYINPIGDGRQKMKDGRMGGSLQMPGGMTEFIERASPVTEQELAAVLVEIDRELA